MNIYFMLWYITQCYFILLFQLLSFTVSSFSWFPCHFDFLLLLWVSLVCFFVLSTSLLFWHYTMLQAYTFPALVLELGVLSKCPGSLY